MATSKYQQSLKKAARKASSIADKQIERLYYRHCSGVQIDIMDINKVFLAGHAAIAKAHETGINITEDELAKVIVDFVQTIRKN
jgi:hypothetical protein